MILFKVLLMSGLLASCGYVMPDADEEAVLIMKPWFFGHGGVSDNPVSAGATLRVWTTSSETFKIVPIQYKEVFTDLMSLDNVPVDFDVFSRLQIKKGETPKLLKGFGKDWYHNNVSKKLRELTRELAKGYPVFKLTTDPEATKRINKEVLKLLRVYVEDKKLPVKVLSVQIGKVNPPVEVLKQTSLTAAQKQRFKTETQRARAELARKEAEENRALADRSYQIKFGLTVREYLSLKALEIQEAKIAMARDKKDVTLIMGDVIPMKQF